MNDLIRREAAIEALRRAEALTKAFGYHNVIDTIRDLPSAQPEIIRCKDCKHNQGSCCDYSAVYIRPNGYCQWAERKDDEVD